MKRISNLSNSAIFEQVAAYLRQHKANRVGIFGSYARGENTPESDLDVLVSFSEIPTLLQLARMERELSELVNLKIDLVTEGALKNQKLRKYIENDLRIVFE